MSASRVGLLVPLVLFAAFLLWWWWAGHRPVNRLAYLEL